MMMFVGAFMEYINEKCKHTAADHLENLNCRGRDLILAKCGARIYYYLHTYTVLL